MNISVSSYSFAEYKRKSGCSYIDICKIAKDMGFGGIEFTEIDGSNPLQTANEIREYCSKIDLKVIAYCVGANFVRIFKKKTVEKLKKQVDIANALGVKLMRHDVCYRLPKCPFVKITNVIKSITPYIKEVSEYANKFGIITMTENHGFIIQAPQTVKALMDEVSYKNYRWLCDIGNFMCVGANSVDGVKTALPYIAHVHVKDFLVFDKPTNGAFKNTIGQYLLGTIPGKGKVDVAECLSIIKNSGYTGYYTLEFEGKEDCLTAIKEGYEYIKNILN